MGDMAGPCVSEEGRLMVMVPGGVGVEGTGMTMTEPGGEGGDVKTTGGGGGEVTTTGGGGGDVKRMGGGGGEVMTTGGGEWVTGCGGG